MSRLGEELFSEIGRQLRGAASDWWEGYRDTLVDLSQDELNEIAQWLRAGNTLQAKLTIARYMTRVEFDAYQKGTIDALNAIANRRAAMIDALEDLSRLAAKAIGRVVLAVLP